MIFFSIFNWTTTIAVMKAPRHSLNDTTYILYIYIYIYICIKNKNKKPDVRQAPRYIKCAWDL